MSSLAAKPRPKPAGTAARLVLRVIALGWLAVLVGLPVLVIGFRAFEDGIAPALDAVTTPEAQHAFYLTLLMVAAAVPLNTVFGVWLALQLERRHWRGKRLVNALVDLPFAVSPVVVGLALVLVYGRTGWVGPELLEAGIRIIFSVPGMVLATCFVSLPFVVREVAPVLREVGTDAEEAARTLGASPRQVLWKITLPAIRWGVAYGVVLTMARALGEFGAVSIVSGKLVGETETATLFVEDRYQSIDFIGAFAAAVVLALIAIAVIASMALLDRRKKEPSLHVDPR